MNFQLIQLLQTLFSLDTKMLPCSVIGLESSVLFWQSSRSPGVDPDIIIFNKLILIDLDNNGFIFLFLLLLDSNQFIFLFDHTLSLFGNMMICKKLNSLFRCNFWSIRLTIIFVIEVQL